jgi:hypothetical protein
MGNIRVHFASPLLSNYLNVFLQKIFNALSMKTHSMKFLFLASIISILFLSCQSGQNAQLQPGVHKAVVKEVIQTNNYTYLFVKENEGEKWLAVPKMQASSGETYYYTGGFEMKDFESKELGRTFPSVYFLEAVSLNPDIEAKGPMVEPHSTGKLNVPKQGVSVKPAEDGITIAELFAHQDKYAGKSVKIRGQVTKYNAAIMKKNWVHIQDGSEYSGKFDLTATTDMEANVGDIITIEGTVVLNKDFGYGYAYDVLLEDSRILINQ